MTHMIIVPSSVPVNYGKSLHLPVLKVAWGLHHPLLPVLMVMSESGSLYLNQLWRQGDHSLTAYEAYRVKSTKFKIIFWKENLKFGSPTMIPIHSEIAAGVLLEVSDEFLIVRQKKSSVGYNKSNILHK